VVTLRPSACSKSVQLAIIMKIAISCMNLTIMQ